MCLNKKTYCIIRYLKGDRSYHMYDNMQTLLSLYASAGMLYVSYMFCC